MWKNTLIIAFSFLCVSICAAPCDAGEETRPVLLIVLDGLRPDYVEPGTMPHLSRLAQEGVVVQRHHSAFPTVTRVNSAVLASGAYPEQNGLLGNQVYFPNIEPNAAISTWDADNLIKIDQAEHGRLLTATSLCEILAAKSKQVLVCGSGSSGSAFLQNHKLNGAVIDVNGSYPEAIEKQALEVLGTAPKETYPNSAQAEWAVDAFLKFGLDRMRPTLNVIWLNEPDHTAHRYGIGAPETITALEEVDRKIGRILDALREQQSKWNILVVSDHGFISHAGGSEKLEPFLEEAGLKTTASDIVVAGGAIYVNESKEEKIPKVVELLRSQPWVGAIYTRPMADKSYVGVVPGTLSTNVIRWNHRRAADIFVEVDWNEDENEFGIPGTNRLSGEAAGHGYSSPYEIHATLLAAGPAFKSGVKSNIPTGNVDVAPTITHLFGFKPAETMQGRVLHELFFDTPSPSAFTLEKRETAVRSETMVLKASFDVIGKYTYLNSVKAEKIK